MGTVQEPSWGRLLCSVSRGWGAPGQVGERDESGLHGVGGGVLGLPASMAGPSLEGSRGSGILVVAASGPKPEKEKTYGARGRPSSSMAGVILQPTVVLSPSRDLTSPRLFSLGFTRQLINQASRP